MRTLGRTGHRVSRLGIGTAGMDASTWRDSDPRAAQRTLYLAIDAGVRFVDTALADGDGDSQKLVGEVIRDLRARDTVVVATRVPPAVVATRVPPVEVERSGPDVARNPLSALFPAGHVVRAVETALRNLRAEVLGLAQLQAWHDRWLADRAWPELRGTLERLVKQGKVLCWGVSAIDHDPGSALAVLDEPVITTVQAIYNIYDPGLAGELLARAKAREIGVIARCPFDEGALSGALRPDSSFQPGDLRAAYFAGERLGQAIARAEKLAALCGDEVDNLAELALRFVLSQPGVDVVIAGMRQPAHLHANLAAAARGPLPDSLLERLREHAWDRNWYRQAGGQADD